MSFAMRRAREQAGRLSLLALIALLVVGGIGGIDAVSDRLLTAGAAQMLTDAEPDARTIRIVATEAPGTSASGAQDAAVREAVAAAFAGVDVSVTRESEPSRPGSTSAPTVTWEVSPELTDLADIQLLQRALTKLDALPDAVDPGKDHRTRVLGALGETLQRQAAAVTATQGLLVAPQLVIGLLCAIVLGASLAALVAARAEELALLRARGASAAGLAVWASAEATAFAAIGVLAALVALAATTGVTAVALLAAASALVLVALGSGLLMLRTVGGADTVRPEARRNDAMSRPLTALMVPAVVAVGLATLSTWQLFATGSVVRADGAADPLAAAAPALVLVAACALVPIAAGPLATLTERMLRNTRGLSPILPLRQIARRAGNVAISMVCVALAAAALAVAVAAPVLEHAAEQRTLAAKLGGDVRVIAAEELPVHAIEVESWAGVTGAEEVLRAPLEIGADTAVLVAQNDSDADAQGASGGVPATITRSLANRLHLEAGQGAVFSARIQTVARPVTFEVTRIVDTIAGIGAGRGVAVSDAALEAAGVDRPANELWVTSDSPVETATQLRAEAGDEARVLTAAQVSAAPVTSVAPALLTVGALVSVVLGVIGFFATNSSANRARRDEPFVLRALGLRPLQQRALRIGETVGIATYAAVGGAALGTIVAVVVLPVVLGAGS